MLTSDGGCFGFAEVLAEQIGGARDGEMVEAVISSDSRYGGSGSGGNVLATEGLLVISDLLLLVVRTHWSSEIASLRLVMILVNLPALRQC